MPLLTCSRMSDVSYLSVMLEAYERASVAGVGDSGSVNRWGNQGRFPCITRGYWLLENGI